MCTISIPSLIPIRRTMMKKLRRSCHMCLVRCYGAPLPCCRRRGLQCSLGLQGMSRRCIYRICWKVIMRVHQRIDMNGRRMKDLRMNWLWGRRSNLTRLFGRNCLPVSSMRRVWKDDCGSLRRRRRRLRGLGKNIGGSWGSSRADNENNEQNKDIKGLHFVSGNFASCPVGMKGL